MMHRLFSYHGTSIQVRHTLDDAPDDMEFILHAHRNYELYYFISGTGHYIIEGTKYTLTPGCLLVMRDGEAHTTHLFGDVPYERICVNFSPETMPLLDAEIREIYRNRPLGKDNFFMPPAESAAYIAASMERLCKDSKAEDYEDRARTIVTALMLELFHLREKQRADSGDGDKDAAAEMSGTAETVRKIIAYINENLTVIKNLDVLEQEFFFSKSYINRIFKQSTGSSVWDYIVLKRLLLARAMLREGKQAAIVASECGFCDYSSFYRQYSRRFGTSPQKARRRKK